MLTGIRLLRTCAIVAALAASGAGLVGQSPTGPAMQATQVADAIFERNVERVLDVKTEKTVEIADAGTFTQSDTLYTLTRDITAPASGLVFERVHNCIIDLGGHTVTYHTEPFTVRGTIHANGIRLRGCSNVIIRNGFVVQDAAPGKSNQSNAIELRAERNVEIYQTVTVIHSGQAAHNICAYYAADGVLIHDNYVVGYSRDGGSGIEFGRVTGKQRIYRNVVFGTHRGVANSGRTSDGCEITENIIQCRRSRGQKSPFGIYLVGPKNAKIHHNHIVSADSRGIAVKGPAKRTEVYENLIDVQYSSVAKGGYYPENRPYGVQMRDTRGSGGIVVRNNTIMVSNAVEGDAESHCEAIRMQPVGPGGAPPESDHRIVENEVTVFNVNPDVICTAVKIGPSKNVKIHDNVFRSGKTGVLSRDLENCKIRNNTFIKPVNARPDWSMGVEGDGNKVVEEQNAGKPPAVPRGLKAVIHFNAIELNWENNPQKNVYGYVVYRDGKKVEPKSRWGGRFFIDDSVTKGRTYRYAISAIDFAGNESARCRGISVRFE